MNKLGDSFDKDSGEIQDPFARERNSALEMVRHHTTRRLTAGLAAAALVVATMGAYEASKDVTPATAASKRMKPLKPAAIRMLITRTGAYFKPEYIRPKSAVMTGSVRNIQGVCNPKNKYNPTRKSTKTVINKSTKKEYVVYCDGYKKVSDMSLASDDSLASSLSRIGTRIAQTANIADHMHGDTVKARANHRVAVLRFRRPDAGVSSISKPVKTITFRNRGKPTIVRYPKVVP